MKTISRPINVAVLLATLAACDGSGPTEPSEVRGSLSVQYSGEENGAFNADATFDIDDFNFNAPTEFAAATTDADGVTIAAMVPLTGNQIEVMSILVDGTLRTGTFTVAANCATDCAAIGFGRGEFDAEQLDLAIIAITGTVTITDTSGGRIRGSFSATDAYVTDGVEILGSAVFTDGSFDVPIVQADGVILLNYSPIAALGD